MNGYNYIFTYGSAVCLHTRTAYFALPRSLLFLRPAVSAPFACSAPYTEHPYSRTKTPAASSISAAGVNLMIAHVTPAAQCRNPRLLSWGKLRPCHILGRSELLILFFALHEFHGTGAEAFHDLCVVGRRARASSAFLCPVIVLTGPQISAYRKRPAAPCRKEQARRGVRDKALRVSELNRVLYRQHRNGRTVAFSPPPASA